MPAEEAGYTQVVGHMIKVSSMVKIHKFSKCAAFRSVPETKLIAETYGAQKSLRCPCAKHFALSVEKHFDFIKGSRVVKFVA